MSTTDEFFDWKKSKRFSFGISLGVALGAVLVAPDSIVCGLTRMTSDFIIFMFSWDRVICGACIVYVVI